MAKVAREMVERAGVNVDQLLELLVKNAAAELTTYYYYTSCGRTSSASRGSPSRRSPKSPGSRTATTSRHWSPGFTSSGENSPRTW